MRSKWIAAGGLGVSALVVGIFFLTSVSNPFKHDVLVPTVIGNTQSEAETTLGDAGFEVAVTSVPTDAKPGTVLEQDPTAGSRADENSTVTLAISTGLGGAGIGSPGQREGRPDE